MVKQLGNTNNNDLFIQESEDKTQEALFLKKAKTFDKGYDFEENLDPNRPLSVSNCRTLPELVYLLESDSTLEIEAKVLASKNKEKYLVELDKKEFVKKFKENSVKPNSFFRETYDCFATDGPATYSNSVGNDFVPLLGGPFNRQMYLQDMLKGHQQAFFAFHHDPIAKQIFEIIKDFTLGRGFRVDCKDPKGLALWDAFAEVNDLQSHMKYICYELSIYGEVFNWQLPNNDVFFTYNLSDGQDIPKGLLPRFRLIDPSTIWDIAMFPEDISRVLFYQLVYPTQYQMYTGTENGKPVPSTKFIFQQVPPEQVDHYKINCVSNEKRGRSDLYPVFGYLKRLRDAVNYSIISLMKQSAFAIDTTIDGNQTDIDSYNSSLSALGDFAPPGSEFVHSKKITRSYMAPEGGRGSQSQSFDWIFSMICSGVGIPQSYFGTHHTAGSTRASAIVATEPVAKKFEDRQLILERILKDMAKRLFKQFGIKAEIEVSFPEVITQDRTAKLKDLALSVSQEWISNKRASEIASKELGITEFNYENEQAEIKTSLQNSTSEIIPSIQNPLTAEPGIKPKSPSAITSDEQRTVKNGANKF